MVIGMKRSLKESAITTACKILSSSAWTKKLFPELAEASFFGGIFNWRPTEVQRNLDWPGGWAGILFKFFYPSFLMFSLAFFLIFFFHFVFSSQFNAFSKLPENLIVREIPEFFEFNDLVSLSQTSNRLRSMIFDHMLSLIMGDYPDFPVLNSSDQRAVCSCLLRPFKYFKNGRLLFRRMSFNNYLNSDRFILALISSPHGILKNTEIAVFIMRTFIIIKNSNLILLNIDLIEDRLIENILPVHFLNKPVIQEFMRFYNCPRSLLLVHVHLHCRGRFKFHHSNFFENRLVFLNYSIHYSFALLITAVLCHFVASQTPNFLAILGMFFFSMSLSEFIYDRFLII